MRLLRLIAGTSGTDRQDRDVRQHDTPASATSFVATLEPLSTRGRNGKPKAKTTLQREHETKAGSREPDESSFKWPLEPQAAVGCALVTSNANIVDGQTRNAGR